MRLNVKQLLMDITDEPMLVPVRGQEITRETPVKDIKMEELAFARVAIDSLVTVPDDPNNRTRIEPEDKIALADLARRIYSAQKGDGMVEIEEGDPKRILDAVDRLYPSPLIYAEMKRIINEMESPKKKGK